MPPGAKSERGEGVTPYRMLAVGGWRWLPVGTASAPRAFHAWGAVAVGRWSGHRIRVVLVRPSVQSSVRMSGRLMPLTPKCVGQPMVRVASRSGRCTAHPILQVARIPMESDSK